jgi:ribosomal-protein-alanine N-acetyltransferase
MTPKKFPRLLTDRLILRKVRKTDWPRVSFLRSDPTVNQFVKRQAANTQEEALAFIERTHLRADQGEFLYWCICLKEDLEMIGSICLWHFSEDRKAAEMGYDLHPKFQKMGLMRESVLAVLDFGFNELRLEKIDAYTQGNNLASVRLLEKANFLLNPDKSDEDNPKNVVFEIHLSYYRSVR